MRPDNILLFAATCGRPGVLGAQYRARAPSVKHLRAPADRPVPQLFGSASVANLYQIAGQLRALSYLRAGLATSLQLTLGLWLLSIGLLDALLSDAPSAAP